MRFVVIVFALSLFVFSLVLAQAEPPAPPEPPFAPENPVQPEDGTDTVQLDGDLNLILETTAERAEEYRYQYWKEGEAIPEPGDQELTPIGTAELLVPVAELEPGAQYFWRARACADIDGTPGINPDTECSPVSDPPWSFTFLIAPPNTDSFSPEPNETGVPFPVNLDWEDVTGAEGYELSVIPCPFWLRDDDGNCLFFLVLPSEEGILPSEYFDDACLFPKGERYAWTVSSCLNGGLICAPLGEYAEFLVSSSAPPLEAPTNLSPQEESGELPVIGKEDLLSWNGPVCGYLYQVRLQREDGEITEFHTREVQVENILFSGEHPEEGALDIPQLKAFWEDSENLDSVFSWSVKACWSGSIGFGGGFDCSDSLQSTMSEFKTTGEAPSLLQPGSGTRVKIPFTLSWDDTDGASYFYQVATDEGFTEIAEEDWAQGTNVKIEYNDPRIIPAKDYWWHIKTCADSEGKVCGGWSESRTFSTHPLNPPPGPEIPLHEGELLLPGSLSWQADPGANYYQYQVDYSLIPPEETLAGCSEKQGSQVSGIINSTSFFFDEKCVGTYSWRVKSCILQDCAGPAEAKTDFSDPSWEFTATPHPSPGAGIVPCDRLSDERSTPYDERESCQIKHLGFLLQNILDFVLWKLSLIVLAVLAVFVGASTYFSFGSPNIITRIRSMFRSYFSGVLLLLFAWLIVNIIMAVFGFNIEFFGNWYEIPF